MNFRNTMKLYNYFDYPGQIYGGIISPFQSVNNDLMNQLAYRGGIFPPKLEPLSYFGAGF